MMPREPKKRADAKRDSVLRWERLIPNDLAEVEGALRSFESFLASGTLAETTCYNALLSLEEAVTNVIKYAFADGRNHGIEVVARLDPSEIIIVVSDDGREFDPLAAPPPDFDLPFEDRPVGGLGIHLLRRLTSRMIYERAGGRNTLTLVFNLDPRT
jgi:anti-sigma regulatory factor (Ser/Thr protein kinase)